MRVIIFITGLLITFQLSSQEKSKADIQIPSTPGISILGIQNAEITKPGTYSGLYSSLISPIVSNNGTIPTDLSLEFSPYYLQSRDITVDELSKTDFLRDFKVSIASTNIVRSDSSTFARMGIGFRTSFLNGSAGIKLSNSEKSSLSPGNDVNTTINIISAPGTTIDINNLNPLTNHISGDNSKTKKKIEKIIIEHSNDIQELIKVLTEYRDELDDAVTVDNSAYDISLRYGSFLEFAGAIAIDFPNNSLNTSEINRWGLWLNYTYRPKEKMSSFDFGAILRISNYSFDPSVQLEGTTYFTDFGGSINLRIPKSKFTVAGEWLYKVGLSDFTATENDNQFTFTSISENKWNLTLGYKISDSVMWTMSLSELNGNSDYIKDSTMQLLMGISAAILPLDKK